MSPDASRGLTDSAKRLVASVPGSKVASVNRALEIVKQNVGTQESMEAKIMEDISRYPVSCVNSKYSLFSDGIFFYADDFDLTNSLQRSRTVEEGGEKTPDVPQQNKRSCDLRFLWNRNLLRPFSAITSKMVVNLIQGFVQIEPCCIMENNFVYCLISRRSCDRGGLRYGLSWQLCFDAYRTKGLR